jgi:hypothetical protein
MVPNNVSETHAESGDPLILDAAETGPLIPFKLVCADLGIGRRTGRRRVPLRDSWSTIHHGEPLGVNPDDKLVCINYGDDLTHISSRKTCQLMLFAALQMMFPPRRSAKKARCAIYTRKSSEEGLEQAFLEAAILSRIRSPVVVAISRSVSRSSRMVGKVAR